MEGGKDQSKTELQSGSMWSLMKTSVLNAGAEVQHLFVCAKAPDLCRGRTKHLDGAGTELTFLFHAHP